MKKIGIRLLLNLGYDFDLCQCSATCCQDAIAEASWLGIWDFTTYTIFSWSLTKRLPFFHAWRHFFTPKLFSSKGEVKTPIKDSLTGKPLKFYCSGISNQVNRWQKCLVFWSTKTLFKFIYSGIKVYSN